MRSADLTRRAFLAAATATTAVSYASVIDSDIRSFWVLKLLKPTELRLQPFGTARLHCSSGGKNWIVEGSETLSIPADGSPICVSGPAGEPVSSVFEIPHVIRRRYSGTFTIFREGSLLIPVVNMECEIATASVVQAELPTAGVPRAALAAQAVVSRSILCAAAKPRHQYADFCDTTHCQFLRSPALSGSKVAEVVEATKDLVVFDRGRILPAHYSAACGGATEATIDHDHQYISVPCQICREGGLPRRGHGWGLCQEGAMGLARLGWTWQAILAKYFPNTTVGSRSRRLV